MQDEINEKVVALSIKGGKLTAAGSLVCCFIREKELVYGYMITGYKLIENLQARLLPFVLDIRKVSGRYVHIVAYILAGLALCHSCRLYRLSESIEVIRYNCSFHT